MKSPIIFLMHLVMVLSSSIAIGQADNCIYTVAGQIIDIETKDPIPFATVQIEGTSNGQAADEDGYFQITNICQKEFNLVITHVGYKIAQHHHDVFHDSPTILLAADEVVLESVVVEGLDIPGDLASSTSTRLSGRELSAVQSESFGDVASQIAGVNTIKTGQNVVKPVIHGLHSNRILVINNGLRHEFQNWGTDHAPEIDPSLLDNLEVIKGASTVRYGPDALGGVILINPAPIELSSHLHGDVKLTGKSNGRSGEGTIKLQKGFKYFGVMGETSWLKQGDVKAPDYNLTNTGKRERSYAAGIRVHPTENININAYYSHFDQELGILRGAVNGNLDDLILALESDIPNDTGPFGYNIATPKQKISHDLYKVQAVYADHIQSVSVRFGYQFNHRREFDVRRGNNNEIPNINLELVSQSIDIDWDHPQIGPLSGKLGVQWSNHDNDNVPGTNTIPFIPNYESDRFGIYLIESIESGRNTFEAGFRYDSEKTRLAGRDRRNDIFRDTLEFDNITATVGLHHKINSRESFRTNFGTSWRPPNVAELYRFGRHLTSIEYGLWRYSFDENNNISTQGVLTSQGRPVSTEVGYKWVNSYELKRKRYQLEVVGYVNYIQDFIFNRPAGVTRTVRGTAPYFIYDQGDALLWGIDISGTFNHNDKWSSTFKGSYLWSRQIDRKDQFVGQPPTNLTYDLAHTPAIPLFDQTELRLSFDYTFKQYQAPRVIPVRDIINAGETGLELFGPNASNFDILPTPPSYFLTHISWRSSIKQFEFHLQVKNLFGHSYRNYTDRIWYFADDIGRNFILSLSYKL